MRRYTTFSEIRQKLDDISAEWGPLFDDDMVGPSPARKIADEQARRATPARIVKTNAIAGPPTLTPRGVR